MWIALGEIAVNEKIDLFAALQNFKSLPLNVQAAAERIKNTFLDIYLADGIINHVFAIYFDGATAGVPYLEAWDDTDHDTAANDFLGGGTAADSSILAITTTNGSPGSATWAGTPLAGTDSRIELGTAALTAAKNLYFSIKQLFTNGTHTPGSSTALVLTLRYLYS
jgi:hypothetical protein